MAAADAAAAVSDQAIQGIWRQVLTILRMHKDPWDARKAAQVVFSRLRPAIHHAMGHALIRAGQRGHDLGSEQISRLPIRYLKHAVRRKPRPVREDIEDKRALLRSLVDPFELEELLATITGTDTDWREVLSKYLIPSPSNERILELLNAGPEPWFEQLSRATRLANPDVLSQIIGNGYAAGKTQREIAQDLLPAVNGVRVSARRIARTEGIRIAHTMQEDADDQLGDLLIGYTIHATHGNPASRQWHLDRDGTQYFKRPGPGQLGFDRMPRPPEESPDPRDRPIGAPKTAYNCLCYRTPILRPL